MEIASNTTLMEKLTKFLSPLMKILFPEIKSKIKNIKKYQ